MEYYSAIKNNEILPLANMDGPRGYYAQWNNSDRERQMPYDLTSMWNLKEQNKQANKTK